MAGEPFMPYGFRIGGNGMQRVTDIAIDPTNGDIIAVGITTSTDLPFRNGAYQSSELGKENGFVMRFNSDCSALKFTVVIGGNEFDEITSTAIAPTGEILITGNTTSGAEIGGFPITTNAFDSVAEKGETDAFFAVLADDGKKLLYSSFIGGEKSDRANDIIVLNNKTIVIVGETESSKFPGTGTVNSGKNSQAFVSVIINTKIEPNSSREIISYLLGGANRDYCTSAVRLSESKFAVTGSTMSSDFPVTSDLSPALKFKGKSDAFAAVFEANQQLTPTKIWCLGGSENEEGRAIAFDGNNLLAIAGATSSADFPLEGKAVLSRLSGKSDAFATICSPTGAIIYSTYLGGSDADSATYAVFAKYGELVISGASWSKDFLWSGLTTEWLSNDYAGQADGFVSVIAPIRQRLLYSSMFGGSKNDVPTALLINEQNNITVAGRTNSPGMSFNPKFVNPVFPAGADDGFIVLHSLPPNLFSLRQTVQFTDTYVGEARTDSVEVTATGLGSAEFNPRIMNDSENNFQVQSAESRKLLSRGTDTIAVIFSPKSAGLKTALLAFISARGDTMRLKIALNGTGKSDIVSANLPIMFGNTDIESVSPPHDVIVKNSGPNKCIIKSANFLGSDAAAFKVLGTFPISIVAGRTAVIPVIFSPKSRRQYLCDMRIETDKGNIVGKVGGTGIGAALIFHDQQLIFARTEVGNSRSDSINIGNEGERSASFTLHIESDAEGNFSIIYPDSSSLVPNARTTVKLKFNPKSEGTKKAILAASGEKFETARITLFGNTVPPSELSLQLAIDTITAHIGESLTIPVRVLSAAGFPQNAPPRYEASLRYNGSILGFGDSSYSTYAIPPWRVIKLTGFYSRYDADANTPLFQVYLTAALGDSSATAVILDSLRWFDDKNEELRSNFIVRNGQVKIQDATEFPGDDILSLKPHPIPATNTLYLDITSPFANPILTLYSVTGEAVMRKRLDVTPNQSQTTSFSIAQLGRGCYIAVLSAGKFTVAECCYILAP
ncbi:MAG: choice-of-anchor D domain-containing protein [Bacteroidetes bacterium]|nr:choice-of-anchor D domain-containing protein [Bacteroidota bacterium]MCZ2132819.1 choice-of-anchor D domain-containing protein [Bacteroidota bacterium]